MRLKRIFPAKQKNLSLRQVFLCKNFAKKILTIFTTYCIILSEKVRICLIINLWIRSIKPRKKSRISMKKSNLVSCLVIALVYIAIALLLTRCGSDALVDKPKTEQSSILPETESDSSAVSVIDSEYPVSDAEPEQILQPISRPKTAPKLVAEKSSDDAKTVVSDQEEVPDVVLAEELQDADENCPPKDIAEKSPAEDAVGDTFDNAPREAPDENPQVAENQADNVAEEDYPTEGSFDGMDGRIYYDTARVIRRTSFPRYAKVKVDGKKQKVKVGDTYSLILSNTYEFVETSYFEDRVEEVKAKGSAHISRIKQGDIVIAQIFVCEKGWRVVGFVKNLSR